MSDTPKNQLPLTSGPITIDPSDPEVQWILSRTLLYCARYAHVFQKAGYPIPTHAEEEQMHILLWMLGLYRDHGTDWRKEGHAILVALGEKIAASANLVSPTK